MENWLISTVPIFLYLFLLIYLDVFAIIRRWRLLDAFLGGIFSCGVLYFCHISADYEIWIPFLEELFKFLFIVVLWRLNKMAFISDSLIYGATAGAGFSLVENLLYVTHNELDISTCIYRGLATSLLHIGTTAFAAVLLISLSNIKFLKKIHSSAIISLLIAIIAVIPSIALHYLHNQMLVSPKWQFFVILVVFLAAFFLLFKINDRNIYNEMDISFDTEVQLTQAIKSGTLSHTPEGRYLLSIQKQFNQYIFFDMLVYVRLATDISLIAKSFFILQELDMEIPEEQRSDFKQKVIELRQLQRNIGKIGIYTLRPIVQTKRLERVIGLFE